MFILKITDLKKLFGLKYIIIHHYVSVSPSSAFLYVAYYPSSLSMLPTLVLSWLLTTGGRGSPWWLGPPKAFWLPQGWSKSRSQYYNPVICSQHKNLHYISQTWRTPVNNSYSIYREIHKRGQKQGSKQKPKQC